MLFLDFLPYWAAFGLSRVLATTAIALLQERYKTDGYAAAFWNKAVVAGMTLPFVIHYGLPQSPVFYSVIFATALLWCVADVIYFKAVSTEGAAVVTRLWPVTIIATFILWFFFDPALFHEYLEHQAKSAAIVAVVLAAVGFALRLRHCAITLKAVRTVWFMLLAACVDSIVVKMLLDSEPTPQGVFAFVFCQAAMMLVLWSGHGLIRKPVPRKVFFAKKTIAACGLIGTLSSLSVSLRSFGLIYVDNPAYISVLVMLDSVLISLFNRWRGKKDESDMVSGFGIVVCAVLLVVIKS